MKVISLRCRKCAADLKGLDKDLVLSCPGCGSLWYTGMNGLEEVKGFTPSDVEGCPDLYLPYYLVRFRDNDFYLPAFRKSRRTSVSDPSLRLSLKVEEHIGFEPFSHAAGTEVEFEKMHPLAYAYAREYFSGKITEKAVAGLKPVLAMMPFFKQGEYLKDAVYGFRLRMDSVSEAEKIAEYYKSLKT